MKKKQQRWIKLIGYFEELLRTQPDRFSLLEWICSPSKNDLIEAMDVWPLNHSMGAELNCGTAACVCGHLPVVFPTVFRWHQIENEQDLAAYSASVCHTDPAKRSKDWAEPLMMEKYFGGTSSQWERIIEPHHYSEADPPLDVVLKCMKKTYKKVWGEKFPKLTKTGDIFVEA